jgi:hypothetical protein
MGKLYEKIEDLEEQIERHEIRNKHNEKKIA